MNLIVVLPERMLEARNLTGRLLHLAKKLTGLRRQLHELVGFDDARLRRILRHNEISLLHDRRDGQMPIEFPSSASRTEYFLQLARRQLLGALQQARASFRRRPLLNLFCLRNHHWSLSLFEEFRRHNQISRPERLPEES